MNTIESNRATAGDQQLVELVDEITARLQTGKVCDVEEYAARFPEYADRLRDWIAVMSAMADLGHSLAAATPSRAAHDSCATSDFPSSADGDRPVAGILGDFRMLRELGRGGMGIVYAAEQMSLGRRVALKVLPFAAMLDKQQLARFKNEARAAATLDHPNIVAVHSVGVERGVHYYAMQLVEGESLAQLIARLRGERDLATADQGAQSAEVDAAIDYQSKIQNPKSKIDTQPVAALSTIPDRDSREYFRMVARLGIQAAEALDHAHQNGILHRDVKPANLLVDDDGKLWITDFGLARIEQDAGITLTGDVLGTLRYMSPEQALAKRVVVDHRSDIYSLGVTLYELLTLQPAYAAEDRQELLRQIAFEEPRRPRQVNAHIPQDLETIVVKAIEKNPTDRYLTAQQLGDDLRRFVAGEPVRAKPPTYRDRAVKWSRRHQGAVLASTVVLALATLGLAIGSLLIDSERNAARTAQRRAETSLALARETVDEMLTKVASTWVAESTATSEVQRQFLQRALAIYQQLANDPPDGDRRGADAALAYERIADIQRHMGDFSEATHSLQSAVTIGQELASRSGAGVASSEQLVRCYRKLASALAQQSQSAAALEAADLGLQHANRILDDKAHSSQFEPELARLLYVRAELLVADGKLAEAMAVAEQVDAVASERLSKPEELSIDDRVLYLQLANLRMSILRRQNRLDEAAKIARPALRSILTEVENYRDSKQLLEVNADLQENFGEILLAQGDAQKAVERFREALSTRLQRLGGHNPTEQSYAFMFDRSRPVAWTQFEPLVIADYCQTQLRLAAALPAVGRPYEAECMLGEALFNAQMNNEARRDLLQFWVLHANAAAAVGERLYERKSVEGQHYLRLAAALWNEMRSEFPQAESFQSGAHGVNSDWEWFRTTHPDFATLTGTRESLKLNNWDTAFWHHMLGRAWFQNERWESASNHFLKSAELRTAGQAYDWLHLAMAYQHLGQPEKAKIEYERAVAAIKASDESDWELESLRVAAVRLLASDMPVDGK